MDVAVVWTGTVAGHVGSNLDLGKSGKRRQRNPAADQFNQANHPPVDVHNIQLVEGTHQATKTDEFSEKFHRRGGRG